MVAVEGSSLGDLARAYAHGGLRPADVAQAILDGIAARADDAVWISRVQPADLLRRADALDRQRNRAADLPLYGVPFAVKDNIDIAGLPTTAGCPEYAYWPDRTAPAVRRLLDAGAILVGKTNLDQFATGLTGSRSPYGAVESVFGGGLIAGGSSSGSAVAVASGLVTFSLGTDTAGSGRVPAAFNGIVGIKPTRGLVSTAGVVPACRSLDCVSVFGRHVADAATVRQVLRGRVAGDPWGRTAPPDLVTQAPQAVRLGVPRAADLEFFGDAGQADRFTVAEQNAGKHVASTALVELGPLFEAGDLLYRGPWVAERLADLDPFLSTHAEAVLPVTRAVLDSGRKYTAVQAYQAMHRLQELRGWADALWERVDALLLPTIGTTFTLDEIAADPIGHNLRLGRYTQFANLLDLAAVTVPNGCTADGRPASITLVGPAFSDATLARLASALTDESAPAPETADGLTIAVAGRHLTGESRNGELLDRGAVLLGAARTAPSYRLYRLNTADGVGLPVLVRTETGGAGIAVELWRLPERAVGGLLAGVPAPLSLGRVHLDDGREVLGFLGEAYATGPGLGAEDITASGGWAAYRAAAL